MIHYHRLGNVPPKHHVTHREDDKLLMEQCMTRAGFDSTYSVLYYRTPPTDEFNVTGTELPGLCGVEPVDHQLLHRRHLRTQDLKPEGDFLSGRRTILLNDDVRIGIVKTAEPAAKHRFSNTDGDECWFAYDKGGLLESVYGPLPFRKHDYVIIPKGTPYRLHPDGSEATFLVFESAGYIDLPKQFRNESGQITMDAPFCHRDFRIPQEMLTFDRDRHGEAPFQHIVKHGHRASVHHYEYFPWDVVGWDGLVYPVAFNIHDYQPRTGAIHQPPTVHITFAGAGFVICSFVPRKVDYFMRGQHKAVPCPYGHWSVDCDEILYYVAGNFTSREGIESQSVSLHPMGVPHGPHPGTYAASVGTERTDELAVMCDTFKPLRLTSIAEGIEDGAYHYTWARGRRPDASTS
ncbi:MAG: homogentisate 1,2-dioxygenase [Phycisphaerae bacterium]